MILNYFVKKILEPEYGCEGRPEGYVAMDTVFLRNEEGDEIVMRVSDKELYDKNINEGDSVYFDMDEHIHKEV